MTATDAIGWAAGTLVLASFYVRTITPLRIVALISNIAFIAYAVRAGLTPILILHSLLLPLNVVRLWQVRKLITRVKGVSLDAFSTEILVPYMKQRTLAAGSQLFGKGDYSEEVFLILKGSVRLVGRGTFIESGQMVGVMGAFTPGRRRIDSAVCESEVELASIPHDQFRELLYQKPEFGAYLMSVIVQRNASTVSSFDGASSPRSLPRLFPKNLIFWGDHFKVDHPQIDAQHEAIFHIALEIAEIWHRQGDFQKLKARVKKLGQVLESHFRFEEQQLAAVGNMRLAEHSAEHKGMLDELQSIRDRVETMDPRAPQTGLGFQIFTYVLGVTAGHISHSDRDDFVVARKVAATIAPMD